MPDLSSIMYFPIKIIFIIHLILVSWSLQTPWCPQSVVLYNLLFFVSLFWAIHNLESDEPLQFALLINVLAIFLDVIVVSIFFRPSPHTSENFSGVILIINIPVRIITSISLFRIGQARNGALATMFPPNPTLGATRTDYEDI